MTRQQLRAQLRADALVRVNAAYGPEPRAARRKIARARAKTEWRKRATQTLVSCGIIALTSLGILSVPQPARAQGTRKDDIVFDAQGHPMAGATVRVCTASATGTPCTPLANIYSDAGMTQAMANPLTTDGLGNYTFYAAAGRYEIEVDGPNITTKQMPNVILPNDPSTPTFTTLTTTSGISAFSLSLSGNLTVNGSTAVTGTLTEGGAPVATTTPSFITANVEGTLPNSRQLVNGTNTTVNTSVPGQISINASGGGSSQVTTFSGRSSPFSTTCTISASSTAMALASASNFQNGDYLACYGAGSSISLSTPSAPAVTPASAKGLLASGVDVAEGGQSTSYSYKIIAFDQAGGFTAASSAGTTSSGDSSLGLKTRSISSVSKSVTTATMTLASSTSELSVGTLVHITGMNNATDLGGWYLISVVNSGTSVAMTQTDSTAYGGTASDSGEGTMTWYVGNRIAWTPVSGAWFYCVYETSPSARFVGCSRPDDAFAGVNEDFVDDWGATINGNPTDLAWIPTTPPSSARNDVLLTQITAGAGTTSVTVATAASNSVTATLVLYDECTPLVAAANTATTTDYVPLYTSGAITIGAPFCALPASLDIRNQASWYLDGTVELQGSPHWIGLVDAGNNALVPGSGYPTGQAIFANTGAIPGFFLSSVTSALIQGMNIYGDTSANQNTLMIADGLSHSQMSNDAFTTGSNSNDTLGIGLVLRSPGDTFQNSFDHNLFNAAELSQDSTWAPSILAVGTTSTVGNNEFYETFFLARGMYWNSAGPTVTSRFSHIQAPITPLFSSNYGVAYVEFEQPIIDSANEPVVANLSGSVSAGMVKLRGTNTDNGNQASLSGAYFQAIDASGYQGGVGQNFNLTADLVAGNSQTGNPLSTPETYGTVDYQIMPRIAGQNAVFAFAPTYGTVTASFGSGGSFAVGTWQLQVAPQFASGAYGAASSVTAGATATAASGTQALTATLTSAVPGAVAYTWYVSNPGAGSVPVVGCIEITSLTCNGTGLDGGYPNAPMVAADGYPHFGSDGVRTPQLTTGALTGALATKSSAYTLTSTDYWVNVTGTTIITVPHAIVGQHWVVFNSGSNTVTVQGDSGNINGVSSITLAANTGKEVACDGTNCFAH